MAGPSLLCGGKSTRTHQPLPATLIHWYNNSSDLAL